MLAEDVTAALLAPLALTLGVLANVSMFSAPRVTLTASGFHSEKALTGPADQCWHDRQ
jgi:hypothetical protein